MGIGLRRFVNHSTPKLILQGVTEHNLQNIEVSFPLQEARYVRFYIPKKSSAESSERRTVSIRDLQVFK